MVRQTACGHNNASDTIEVIITTTTSIKHRHNTTHDNDIKHTHDTTNYDDSKRWGQAANKTTHKTTMTNMSHKTNMTHETH